LLNAPTDYTDKELEMGFEAVERFLGKTFLDVKWKGQRGIAMVNQVVNLGLDLISVCHTKGFDKLITRLQNSTTYSVACSELACASPFAKSEVLTQLYPSNPDKNGELEMKLETKDGKLVFVEVVSPRTQIWNTFLMKLIEPIRKRTTLMQNMRLEVFIYKILDENEQLELFYDCGLLVKTGQIDSENHKEGKYHIFLSHADTIKINTAEKKTEEQTTLFVTNLTQMNGHKNLITVGVPFADQRAQQVLEGEYHQLTSNYPNIIVIDVSGVPKGLDNWPIYIKRRLQPTLNRKISAVLLHSGVNSKRMEIKHLWIHNRHAHHTLDQEFLDLITL
jgi:hypothetical protein